MKITFYTLTILVFPFFLTSLYSEETNSKSPSEQRQESIIIAANESSDPPFILNEVSRSLGAYNDYQFGYSVAIFEDLAVVGVPRSYDDTGSQTNRGSVQVFRRVSESSGWESFKTLLADDGEANDEFGLSVATNGDFIVVGAPYDDVNEFADSGSAYIFYRNQGGTDKWGQVAKLTPNDPESYAHFGHSVALGYGVQFKTALVGAPDKNGSGIGTDSGAAYIFNEGIQIKKLTAPDARAYGYFGYSVAYTDNWFNWIVVGAPGNSSHTGSAYLFERDWGSVNSWGFNGKITHSDGDDRSAFGWSVAISGDTVVIGALSAFTAKGAAYVFKPFLSSWVQAKKLMPTDGENYGGFGGSVAVEGDVVAVGASTSPGPGWGYAFKRNEGGPDNWGQYARLAASDGEEIGCLGYSIDISGSTVIAGDICFPINGAVYFFDLPATKTTLKAMPWIPLLLLDE